MMLKQYLSAREHILSRNIHDESGEHIGKIEDFLVDPDDSQPKIVIMSSGGILGIGGDHLALPFKLLRFNPQSSDVRLSIASARVKKAPKVDLSKLRGNDKEELKKLQDYYGSNAFETGNSGSSVDGGQYTQEAQDNHPHEGYEGSAKITGEEPKNKPDNNPSDDMDYEKLKWGQKS